ncbi:hypothetical protein KM043_004404 [Ampulex compressa]|nr:hypothetical protein KM043_004404 [Ampulex compressa]
MAVSQVFEGRPSNFWDRETALEDDDIRGQSTSRTRSGLDINCTNAPSFETEPKGWQKLGSTLSHNPGHLHGILVNVGSCDSEILTRKVLSSGNIPGPYSRRGRKNVLSG